MALNVYSQEKHRRFTLADVGKVIQSLIMDRYKAPYQDLEHEEKRGENELEDHNHDASQSNHYINTVIVMNRIV